MKLIVLQDGHEHEIRVERRHGAYEVELGGRILRVDSVRTNGMVRSLVIEGRQFEVAVRTSEDGRYQVSSQGTLEELEVLDPLTYLASQGADGEKTRGGQKVTAYMPGRVVRLLVAEGDAVEPGQGMVVLEAMKMENEIEAERSGRVARVFVEAGQAVEGGDPLFEFE